jgi:hypothetical protein
MLEEIRNKKRTEPLKQPIVSGSYDMNKLSKLIKEIYMQGYYDRDWKISEDSADEIAETLSIKKILDRCKA